MKKKLILFLVLTIISLSFMTGCENKAKIEKDIETLEDKSETVANESDEPEYGGELVVPITTIKSLNPLLSENASFYHFSKLIFESLFQLDSNLNIENCLAEDYSIRDEGKVVDIRLKDDVYWHDGEKFTADDVAFTINAIKYGSGESAYKDLILNGLKPFSTSDIRHILDVKIVDDYNLEIYFDRSYSNALEILTFPIVPKHRFIAKNEKASYINALNDEGYNPIGTGPYKFSQYEKLKTIKLVANEEWWKGRPYIDTIVGKVLDDEELSLTAFETGQVDLANTVDVDWEKYTQKDRVKIYEYVSQNYEFLAFNFKNEIFADESGLAIRKAIAYGIDRQAIIQKVYLGHATQTDLPIHPDSWLLNQEASIYGYNKSKAKEVLDKAGWIDRDGDGICEDENGNKLSIRLSTNSYNPLRFKTAEMIAENLKQIGIEVIKDYAEEIPDKLTEEMIENDWETFRGKLDRGNFDVALLGWQLSSVPDLSFAFHSSQIQYGTNFISYQDEEMDELLVEAFSAPNREMKKNAYDKLETKIVEELPYVSLFFRNKALLLDKKVKGNIEPQFYNIYDNIEEWYIPKKYQQK
ncbi:MAG: Peptide/nickel transport system substrate-binding protein [Sporanaerobacter sp.]|uniref:peptide ABC transporter substrate-binding protein n=1 Tax=Sporanaerobacter sp. TaxID=2010183 RepID=UPI003A102EE4